MHAKSLTGACVLDVHSRFSLSSPSHFRVAFFVCVDITHLANEAAGQRLYLVSARQLHLSAPLVTSGAVCPHSPTQPSTSRRGCPAIPLLYVFGVSEQMFAGVGGQF